MGTKYAAVAVSGYNATPPSDDGATTEANKLKWSTIKTKLPDPLKTAIEAVDSRLQTHFNVGPTAITSNTTLGASHYNQIIQVSGSGVTLTLSDAATLGAGWFCWIVNTDSSNSVTLARATGGDTINGTAANYTIAPGNTFRIFVIAAASGFRLLGNSNANGSFPSGTAMLFAQTAAPTGWTKSTTHNDKALRVVSGTASSGGATAFTSVFGSGKSTGSYALQIADIPSHSHTDAGHAHRIQGNDPDTLASGTNTAVSLSLHSGDAGSSTLYRMTTDKTNSASSDGDLNTGSGAASIGSTGGGGGHSHTLSLDIQYVDVIIATKD